MIVVVSIHNCQRLMGHVIEDRAQLRNLSDGYGSKGWTLVSHRQSSSELLQDSHNNVTSHPHRPQSFPPQSRVRSPRRACYQGGRVPRSTSTSQSWLAVRQNYRCQHRKSTGQRPRSETYHFFPTGVCVFFLLSLFFHLEYIRRVACKNG